MARPPDNSNIRSINVTYELNTYNEFPTTIKNIKE